MTTLQLSDQQLKDADQETRRWWARVYILMNESGCSIEYAIRAIRDADRANPTRNN